MTWRVGELVRDTFRGLGWPQVVLALAALLVLTAGCLLATAAAQSALRQEIRVRQAGAAIWSVQADENEHLAASACTAIAYQPGVVSAGAMFFSHGEELSVFPGGVSVPLVYVTPGLSNVFVPAAPPAVITSGSDLVRTGRVGVGGSLFDESGRPIGVVEALLPSWTPVSELASGIAVPTQADYGASECWVRMEPGAESAGPLVLRAAFGENRRVTNYAPRDASLQSAARQWDSVISLRPGVVAGVAIGLVAAMLHWFRRREFALRRTFGATITSIGCSSLVEAVALFVPASAATILVTNLWWLRGGGVLDHAILSLTFFTAGAGAGIALVLYVGFGLLFASGRPADALSDH